MKPKKNITADVQMYNEGFIFLERKPPTNPPKQKKIITIVKVIDNVALDQAENSSAIEDENTDHAYTIPDTSRIMIPDNT